jgi:hypothetical protein
MGRTHVHRRQGSGEAQPQPVEFQLTLRNRELRRILRPHGADGIGLGGVKFDKILVDGVAHSSLLSLQHVSDQSGLKKQA